MTKIILSGCCGKMGRFIVQCCSASSEYTIVAGVDIAGIEYADFPVYTDISYVSEVADVVIDFSNPSAISSVLNFCLANNLPAVIATTGFSAEQITAIHNIGNKIPVFFSANMSLGINLVAALAKKAAQVLGDGFDIEIIEKHHNQKIDAPSGTALLLADAISSEIPNSTTYTYDRHLRRTKRDKHEIGIHSVRGGTIVGEHQIIFAGHDEVIELTHSAASKEVFALGALRAASFICNKAARIYDMNDMISL